MSAFLLMRLLLPLSLGTCVLLRQNMFSLIYLLLLFFTPFVGNPSEKNMSGLTGSYLLVVMVISILITIAQILFQILLISNQPYGYFLPNCGKMDYIIRHIGLLRLDSISPLTGIRLLTPEVIMVTSSITVYVLCYKWTRPSQTRINQPSSYFSNTNRVKFVRALGKYVSTLSLCVAGCIQPSVPGALYFLVFIGTMTLWSIHQHIGKWYTYVLCGLAVVVALHILALFAVQTQWVQEMLPRADCNYCRYFGLTILVTRDCLSPQEEEFPYKNWDSYLNPPILLGNFYILAMVSRMLCKLKVENIKPRSRLVSVRNEEEYVGISTNTPRRSANLDRAHASWYEKLIKSILATFDLISHSSFIASSISMMVWSITYHSWVTFVLLLWAIALCVIPNHRRRMETSSPFLVFYSVFLLLCQYLYSMDLSDMELPQEVAGINLLQLGFVKTFHYPIVHLLSKCLFTLVFWTSLRRFTKKKRRVAKRMSTKVVSNKIRTKGSGSVNNERSLKLKKVILHILDEESSFKSTTFFCGKYFVIFIYHRYWWSYMCSSVLDLDLRWAQKPEGSFARIRAQYYPFIIRLGSFFKHFFTKHFIWIVVITLVTISLVGEKMTLFRILYMVLFLIFILTFQVSYQVWRKMTYFFWWTVIIYCILILILIYTYQFDHFPKYWHQYLGIPKSIQHELGLERYETGIALFMQLLSTVFFLIITVIQLHYCHKEFLKMSELRQRSGTLHQIADSKIVMKQEHGPVKEKRDRQLSLHPHKHEPKIIFKQIVSKMNQTLKRFAEIGLCYLELHMIKIVLVIVVLLCVYNICAPHLVLMVLVVIAVPFGRNIQILIINVISVLSSLHLMSIMIYQLDHFQHHQFNVNCSVSKESLLVVEDSEHFQLNDAHWFGLRKKDHHSLAYFLIGHIGLLVVTTLFALVEVVQLFKRHRDGVVPTRPLVLFPQITRVHADCGVEYCLKYLINYGFYKFGVEICLVMMVVLIAFRMDVYALFYAFWLCLLFSINRENLGKFWFFLKLFIMIVIPIQYFMVIGLPPGLCIEYYFYRSGTVNRLVEWLHVSNPKYSPYPQLILCDIVLLLFVCQQSLVMNIERRSVIENYPGGSNKCISWETNQPDFVNPVPDFITYTRSWLDGIKRVFIMVENWLVLGIVFMAGTSQVNLFSIGYLVGTFILMWQGRETYLMPISVIKQRWNFLLAYNVGVITLKTAFQIVGCVFAEEAHRYSCWVVQLLGIVCSQSPKDLNIEDTKVCTTRPYQGGVVWDGICFAALIFRRRLFNSYYFLHLVNELKAMRALASRGAELIEELKLSRIVEQQIQERQTLKTIKVKMERIKSTQQKIQGARFKEPENHSAVRSGDYFMFDEVEDVDEDENEDDDENLLNPETRGITVSKFLATAIKTDMENAADLCLDQDSGYNYAASIVEELIFHSTVGFHAKEISRSFSELNLFPETNSSSANLEFGSKFDHPSGSEAETASSDIKTKKSGLSRKIWILIKFLLAFVESCIVSITQYLNMKTRDFRYVIRSLAAEKKLLKEKFNRGKAENESDLTTRQLDNKLIKTKNFMLKSSQPPFPLPERDIDKSIEFLDLPEETAKKDHIIDSLETVSSIFIQMKQIALNSVDTRRHLILRTVDQPLIVQMFIALYYALLSHSELISYLAVFIHQMKSASILSLPLPLMVFLWGTLNIPRPSKTFWVTLIAYTETIVIVKCVYQFDLIAWNQQSTPDNEPLYPPLIIGIEQKTNYFFIDLVLLLVLFSHRIMLKTLGLWKSDYEDPVRFTKKEEMFIVESTSLDMALFSHDDNNQNETTRGGSSLSPVEGIPSYKPHFRKQVLVRTEVQNIMDHYPAVIKLAALRYFNPMKKFFKNLLAPRPRHTVDVYTPMFFCDFLNFLVIVIGVESFAQEYSGDVMTYLMENKVPMLFLSMLLLQFFLIVVDRALYLRKNIVGKIVFHHILVIGIHIWMFFVLPGFTERQFNMRLPPQIWYMFKCIYFLLSAYQIRCGYPTRIIGNVFCKKYNISNFVLLIGYLNLPFLYELRTLMDWMWTDTSMSVFEWLKMEDIFNNVFQTKCSRRIELKYPQSRGVKKRALIKYLMGGGAQLMIIAMIWLPLLVFALGRQVGKPNIPYEGSVSLSIGAYTPLYTMKAKYIKSINEQQWSQMINIYKANRESSTILSGYDEEDIGVISLGGNSTAVWGISPPDLDKLILEVKSSTTLVFKLKWNLRRHSNSPTVPEEVTGFSNWDLIAEDPQRKVLASMLSKTNTSQSLKLHDVLPKFLKVTSQTKGVAMKQLLDFNEYLNLTIRLHYKVEQVWWELREENCDNPFPVLLRQLPYFSGCKEILIYTLNDKVFPAELLQISGGGIIGFYIFLVTVTYFVSKKLTTGMSYRIIYEDMPYVDHILQLCHDIYLVRESGELALEEDLYAKLVFLYRSPETIIKLTRVPEQ